MGGETSLSNKTAVLRGGREVLVRTLSQEDKEKLVAFYASLSTETLRWALPPYDRQRIERWITNLPAIGLVAEHQGRIIGNLNVFIQPMDRLKGIGELIIYLHQDFQKAGLGTVMMKRAIEFAKDRGLHRLQLSVVADNRVAIRLYEKMGFNHEGLRKQAFLGDDGHYHDLVEMGLLV